MRSAYRNLRTIQTNMIFRKTFFVCVHPNPGVLTNSSYIDA